MPIKITSTQEGFRRCGMVHGREPVIHEDGVFTKEQITLLQKEPMLKVEIVNVGANDDSPGKKKKKGEE